MAERSLEARFGEALKVVDECEGKKGFYASVSNYSGQYWLRDLVFSLPILLRLGRVEKVKAHLTLFFEAYRRWGKVPALICERGALTYFTCFFRLLGRPSRLAAYPLGFMLPNLSSRGFQPWTGDSPLLLLIGVREFEEATEDRSLAEGFREEAGRLLEEASARVEEGRLPTGGGWMDAMANYVGKPCLILQVLLYRALKLHGREKLAGRLRSLIFEAYWREGFLADLPGGDRLDVLGNALAILYRLLDGEKAFQAAEAFSRASTEKGILNLYPPYPKKVCGQKPHVYHNSTIWPLVQGYAAEALASLGLKERAEAEYRRILSLPGLNEWYGLDGKPRGSPKQLWTAAQVISACWALGFSEENQLV